MFYDASKAEFKILLYIENILPSRLGILFDIKKVIDNLEIFKKCMVPVFENKKKIGDKSLELNFGILRDIFYDFDNKRWISRKYFLDIVNRIFTNKSIQFNFLINFITQKLRGDFINPNNWFGSKNEQLRISTLKGFMILNYINELKILKLKEEVKMETENLFMHESEEREIKKRVELFFNKYSNFFNINVKRAIFLEGILTQYLLNIQYQERKATPFRIKLKGLKLDEKQIKKLLPEIQNKLEEYEKNYYRELESIISEYFVSSGNDWNISNDEISFYFVLGMNLSNLFKKEKNNGGKKDE